MQDDAIRVRLGLPGLIVLGVKETERWIEVAAQCREEESGCPRCGRSTWQVHQWHPQRKRDAKLWGKDGWLALFKRRFRCRHCRKVFTEPDRACGSRRRTTRRLRHTAGRRAREATPRSSTRSLTSPGAWPSSTSTPWPGSGSTIQSGLTKPWGTKRPAVLGGARPCGPSLVSPMYWTSTPLPTAAVVC